MERLFIAYFDLRRTKGHTGSGCIGSATACPRCNSSWHASLGGCCASAGKGAGKLLFIPASPRTCASCQGNLRLAAIRRVKPAASNPRSTLVKLGGSPLAVQQQRPVIEVTAAFSGGIIDCP